MKYKRINNKLADSDYGRPFSSDSFPPNEDDTSLFDPPYQRVLRDFILKNIYSLNPYR